MKNILLQATADPGFEGRFEAALDVVRAFDGHLLCVHSMPFDSFLLTDPFGGVYAMPNIVEKVRADVEAQQARIEEKLRGAGVSWSWMHFDGEAGPVLTARSALADLVVVSLDPAERGGRRRGPAPDLAMHARGPVLAVPQGCERFDFLGTAMVAWNGAPEAAHALRAALPFLARSSAVHLVTVAEEISEFPATAGCEYLARHGIAAELHEWPAAGEPVAARLLDAAAGLGARYIVAGAYGHSRLGEAVFGGVTRGLLEQSSLPLVLAH